MVHNNIKFAFSKLKAKDKILYVNDRIVSNYIYDPRKYIFNAIKSQDKDFIIMVLKSKGFNPELLTNGKLVVHNSKKVQLEPIIKYISESSVEITVERRKILIQQYKSLQDSLLEILKGKRFRDNSECKNEVIKMIDSFTKG